MIHKLLKLIPPHQTYCEPFGGAAALLFAKPPSPVEVYNDVDSGLVNLFRVLRDPEKFEQFYYRVCLTLYSREEYYYCLNTWQQCEDDVEKAYRFFVVARMSFGGHFGHSWGFEITKSARGMVQVCSRWLAAIEDLPYIHARLMQVQIENRDFRELIPIYDTPDTLFYCDPPYVPDTRRDGWYKHEVSLEDHQELVELLLKVKGKALLSGYRHKVYEPLEKAGWQRLEVKTACSVVGRTRYTGILGKGAALRKQPRVECIWVSPNAAGSSLFTLGGDIGAC